MICALISISLFDTDLVEAGNLVISRTGMYNDEYKFWCRLEQKGDRMGLDDWQDVWQEEIQIADQANPNRAQGQGHDMNQVEEQEIEEFDRAVKVFTASQKENQEKMNSVVKLNKELRQQINFLKQLHQPPTTTTPQQ